MITGIVLAGGRSSRMGRDKALLPVDGRLLVELVIARLRPCVDRLLVVGHPDNVVRLSELAVDAVYTDLRPGFGPLMGLYTGLMAADTPLAVAIPCDMPWIEASLIRVLVQACRDGAPVTASVYPADRLQPFPLACRVQAARAVGALLTRGERAIHALLAEPGAARIPIQDPALRRCFTNVNTVADYLALTDDATVASRP
jgi:molybdopterin-guanine dinucleotide biosynthesis protein A